jgi:hypothetical protein
MTIKLMRLKWATHVERRRTKFGEIYENPQGYSSNEIYE